MSNCLLCYTISETANNILSRVTDRPEVDLNDNNRTKQLEIIIATMTMHILQKRITCCAVCIACVNEANELVNIHHLPYDVCCLRRCNCASYGVTSLKDVL